MVWMVILVVVLGVVMLVDVIWVVVDVWFEVFGDLEVCQLILLDVFVVLGWVGFCDVVQ